MDEGHPPSSGRRRRRWPGIALAILALLVAFLWIQRVPIASGFIERELAARGVKARYRVTGIGPRTQRIEDVVLGDPAAPDLVARRAEIDLGWGFGGPYVRAIRARGVRLAGRIGPEGMSLGMIDRLLPQSSGGAFTLPDILVDLADAQMRLDSRAGPILLALDGTGNLASGFVGRLRARAPRLAAGDCIAAGVDAPVTVRTRQGAIALNGPVRAGNIACGPAVALNGVGGRVNLALARDLSGLTGGVAVVSHDGALAGVHARNWRYEGGVSADFANARGRLQGEVGFAAASAPAAILQTIDSIGRTTAGSPLGPTGMAFAQAAVAAARRIDGNARITLDYGARPTVTLHALQLESASGARLGMIGDGLRWSAAGGASLRGDLRVEGGGLPSASATFTLAEGGGEGIMRIAPYAAPGGLLALDPLRISGNRAGWRIRSAARVDGPLGDGSVTGLRVPILLDIAADGRFTFNPGCQPLGYDSLSIAGLRLAPARLPLCASGAALVYRTAGGPLRGGGAVDGLRLSGRLGGEPATLASRRFGFDLGSSGFVADAVAVRLGSGDAVSRLDIARLDGRATARGLDGRFDGLSGKIAAVPLQLSEGRGGWQLHGAVLDVTGGLRVADSEAQPRFNTLTSENVRLRLAEGKIRATGLLREPRLGTGVVEVAIAHDLARGAGTALLDVPGITFGPALQPERLTRLTLGVVANVAGTVRGNGRIDWGPRGVTSGGTFRTDSLDLAAAFGPVSGISGEIRFSDLLGLETPPGQEVRLREVNPGVAVNDGVVRYRLLTGQRVAIEGGRWPFSGGELILEPTVMDFANPVARHMTFRVAGLDAAQFIQRFEFDNVAATGVFDGLLPMVFDDNGGRIVDGRLTVRPGGGTLAYVGEVSNADLGTFGSLAFDALKSIRYDNLAIELDGAIDGELISRIVFNGVNEQPLGDGEAKGMLRELTGLPFKFNIVIRAPFRGLISTASAFVDPTGLIRSQRQQAGEGAVQPQESEDKR